MWRDVRRWAMVAVPIFLPAVTLERELSLIAWRWCFGWRFESAEWAAVHNRLADLLLEDDGQGTSCKHEGNMKP